MTLKELSIQYAMDAKLLKRYFEAFANLYGICPLQKAKNIINRQNPEMKLNDEQILGFADGYKGSWRIVSPDDVFSNVPPTKPMRREIVNRDLIYYSNYSVYADMRNLQGDKDYNILPKDELLKYASERYYEETLYTKAVASYMQKKHIADWELKLEALVTDIRIDNSDIQQFLDFCEPTEKELDKVLSLYNNLHNHTRMMANRGFTPHELAANARSNAAPNTSIFESISFGPGIQSLIQNGELDGNDLIRGLSDMDIPPHLKESLVLETQKAMRPSKDKTPGRNDPCPCGSGKKFKHCCSLKIH